MVQRLVPHFFFSPSIIKKSHLMRFNKSPLYFNYLIEDTVIANKSSIKDLVVLLSSDLTWSLHVSYITVKSYSPLGFSIVLLVIATLLVQLSTNQIMYASPIWRPHLKKEFVLLERILRATKFILGIFFRLQVPPNKSTPSLSYDGSSDYKYRLTSLHLLSLMMALQTTSTA